MNTPVSFEIAKLLKEKGFSEKVRSMYCEDKLYKDTKSKGNYNDVEWVRTWRNSSNDDTLSAPTIAEVVMWLYEKHGIWISVIPYNDEELSQTLWENTIIHITDNYNDCSDYTFYHSPTEAYEAAIIYVLNEMI